MIRRLVAVFAVVLLSCKTAPAPAPEPRPEPVDAGAPVAVAPPEPVVELPAAAPLPAMPKGLTFVRAPDDNVLTAEKAELGNKLFFDKRLSKDDSMACANCHHIDKAYTSGNALDAKVGGANNKRNSPTVLNLGAHPMFYWDGRMPTLEAVSNAAWKGQLGADPAEVAKKLNGVPVYKALFVRAFNEPATATNVPQALASYFRALTSGNSPWDTFTAGDAKALTKQQQHGQKVFLASGCANCHVPPMFTDFAFHIVLPVSGDEGRKDATKDEADVGKFMTPSLRNVALTGPYFHDGRTATLEAAISQMASGPAKDEKREAAYKAVKLSAKDAADLKVFLESLTGESSYTAEPTLP
jgi:cytochrome c peroxidase